MSKPLNQDMDARRWADEFNEVIVANGGQPHDPGWLIGWFANAIMCGHDNAAWKLEKEIKRLRESLKKYGEHAEVCHYQMTKNGHKCICGFDEALEYKEGGK